MRRSRFITFLGEIYRIPCVKCEKYADSLGVSYTGVSGQQKYSII
jgi:hypothetical protein